MPVLLKPGTWMVIKLFFYQLISDTSLLFRVCTCHLLWSFDESQFRHISRSVRSVSSGMIRFSRRYSINGYGVVKDYSNAPCIVRGSIDLVSYLQSCPLCSLLNKCCPYNELLISNQRFHWFLSTSAAIRMIPKIVSDSMLMLAASCN